MSSLKFPVKGSCQCGAVHYTVLAAPLMVIACHCKQCQILSTSAFSITAVMNAADVVFEGDMADWQRVAESGNIAAAKFCRVCGNRIYHYNPAAPDLIKLKPSGLEDTSLIQPTAHAWVSEKQAWYQIPEGVKVFDKQP